MSMQCMQDPATKTGSLVFARACSLQVFCLPVSYADRYRQIIDSLKGLAIRYVASEGFRHGTNTSSGVEQPVQQDNLMMIPSSALCFLNDLSACWQNPPPNKTHTPKLTENPWPTSILHLLHRSDFDMVFLMLCVENC